MRRRLDRLRHLGSGTDVRRPLAGAVVAMILLVACSPSSQPSGNVEKGPAPNGATEVVIDDSAFHPDVLEPAAGKEVTVQLTNHDDAAHDFAIEALDLNTGTIEAQKTAHMTFTVPDKPVQFVCTFHPGMDGRIEPE